MTLKTLVILIPIPGIIKNYLRNFVYMKIRILILLAFTVVANSQPRDFKREFYLNDLSPNQNAAVYATAKVKSMTTFEPNTANKEKIKSNRKDFDSKGNMLRDVYFLNSGGVERQIVYTYDSFGHMIEQKEIYYRADTVVSYSLSTTTYNLDSRKTESRYSNTSGSLYYSSFKYDDKVNSVTEINYTADGNLSKTRVYVFDKAGWVQKVQEIGSGGISETIFKYYKDSVEMKLSVNDSLTRIECAGFDEDNNMTYLRITHPGKDSYLDYIAEFENGIKSKEKSNYATEGYWHTESTFNEKGDLITEDNYSQKNLLLYRNIFEYNDKRLMTRSANGDKNVTFNGPCVTYSYEYY